MEHCDSCYSDKVNLTCQNCNRWYCNNCWSDYDDMGISSLKSEKGYYYADVNCDACTYGCKDCRLWKKCDDCDFCDFFDNYSEKKYLEIKNLL